ncbi:MAG: hypothetical protein QXR53_02940 [Candidatus Norongarragalinales archaeon]
METARKALLLLLLLVVLSNSVFSVGIRPARLVYPFQEGRELGMDYTIINRGPVGARFAVYTCGTFFDKIEISSVSSTVFSDRDCTAAQRKVIAQLENGDITLDEAGVFLNPREEKMIQAKIKLPSVGGFEPGIVETRIGAVDLPLTFKPGETVVGGIAAVEAQLWLKVPYPGKRFVISPATEDVEWGKKAKVRVSVTSEGSEDVKNAVLTVDILDSQGVRKDRIVFDAKDIASGESVEYSTLWDTKQVEPGTYTLLFRLSFEGQAVTQEAQFRIGGLDVRVSSVEAQAVAKGGIAKIIVSAESKWGDAIPGIYADILVNDAAGKSLVSLKTRSEEIGPFGRSVLEAFWETGDAPSGKYDLLVTLHYSNKTSEGKGAVEIMESVSQQTPVEYVALAVVVILLIVGAWFLRGRVKIEPEQKKQR